MNIARTAVALTGALCVTSVDAQTLTQQQRALAIIRETAADLCGSVPVEQSNQKVELTGSAKAKLSGAVGKIVNAGLSGAARYSSGTSKGVLQKDLAQAIKNGSDCRRSVFQTLVPRMLPPASGQVNALPKPALVNKFIKPVGFFKKEGALWIEYPPYAPNRYFTFSETGRDRSFVYLVDTSRNRPGEPNNAMIVRLPLEGGSAQWSYQNPVTWVDMTVVVPAS